MMPHRRVLGVLALFPAAWIFWRAIDVPHFGFLLDDAVYMASAKSLAEGNGYRIASLPGEPHQTKYPPGYPLLLSLVWRVAPDFPANLRWAAAMGAVAFAAMSWLAWRGSPLVAVNPVAIFYGASLMSETVGLCALLGAFALVPVSALVAGVCGGLAFLVRAAALPLLVVGPAWYAMRRDWRGAGLFACGMLPWVAGWQWWSASRRVRDASPQMSFYTDYFGYLAANFDWGGLGRVLGANLEAMLMSMGGLIWFDVSDGPLSSYRKTLVALVALGGVVRLVRGAGTSACATSVYAMFGSVYCLILLPWNFSPNERFLLPVLPLLLAGIVEAMRGMATAMFALWSKGGGANRGFAACALAGLGVAGLGWGMAQWRAITGYFPALLEQQRMRPDAYSWTRNNLPGDAVVLAYQESRLALHTGRHAIGMPLPSRLGYEGDRKRIAAYFDTATEVARREGARYLYVTPQDFELDLDPAERAAWRKRIETGGEWRLLHRSGEVSVHEVVRRCDTLF